MSKKNENKIFLRYNNVEKKAIPWWKYHSDHFKSKSVKKLKTIHKSTGFCFYIQVLEIIADEFDSFNAGALKTEYQHFQNLLYPLFKKRETMLSFLEKLKKLKLIYFWRAGIYVVLYSPFLEKVTKNLARDRKRKYDEDPADAGDLLSQCKGEIKGELL